MAEYIEREALMRRIKEIHCADCNSYHGVRCRACWVDDTLDYIDSEPAADVAEVRHGRWILEAHDERVNYRWNVTAECSNCCDEKKEIWAGFFPNVPDWLARDTALIDAKSVKLSNYCQNCGAKMDGGDGNSAICSKTT